MTSFDQSGTFTLGGRTVKRLGYGAMQLAGPGVFGPPKDHAAALAVLREAVIELRRQYFVRVWKMEIGEGTAISTSAKSRSRRSGRAKRRSMDASVTDWPRGPARSSYSVSGTSTPRRWSGAAKRASLPRTKQQRSSRRCGRP